MKPELREVTAPTPIATIDSPNATMMTSPCRSAKCAAEFSRHPDAPARIVPT